MGRIKADKGRRPQSRGFPRQLITDPDFIRFVLVRFIRYIRYL